MGGILQLAIREIGFRKGDFLLGVAAVTVAAGCLVASVTLLHGHSRWTDRLADQFQEDTLALMRQAEDDYRQITVDMGYNVLVLSKAQDMAAYLDQGYATETMPEDYVSKLGDSKLVTVRHLVPTLQQRITWPEQGDMPVILLGTRSEYPMASGGEKKPIEQAVAPGTMRIGRVVHEKLGINAGDRVTLLGRAFEVAQVNQPRGNEDDISIWIQLDDAQALLNRPGEINAIMALSCHCADQSLPMLQKEITGILPGTQVIQLANMATARGKTRDRAMALTEATTGAQETQEARLRQEREALAAWLVPLAAIGAALWIGYLMLANVRARRHEIGVLRALGYGTPSIMALFLARAAGMGLLGAAAGLLAGFFAGGVWARTDGIPADILALVPAAPGLVLPVLIAAPIVACAASWLPAVIAARQDPADVLREV
jgi:putative ABC transport system permease protein